MSSDEWLVKIQNFQLEAREQFLIAQRQLEVAQQQAVRITELKRQVEEKLRRDDEQSAIGGQQQIDN